MNKPPAFQFYASDWAHSVSDFTLEERGAYITLLAWSWERGPVPNDIKRIALILHVSPAHAKRVWETVSRRWELRSEGAWINPRLERTRAEASAYAARQSERGKAGASARWVDRSNSASSGASNAPAMPEALPKQCLDDSLRSPISDLQEDPRPSTDHSVSDLSRARAIDPAWRPARPPQAHCLTNGAEQRRHGMHAWCCDRGLCVTWGLHSDFVARLGGEKYDARLRAWYAETVARYAGRAVGDDLFVFWRNEFASWVGTVTSRPSASRTGDTMDAGQKSLRARLERLNAEEGESHVRGEIEG